MLQFARRWADIPPIAAASTSLTTGIACWLSWRTSRQGCTRSCGGVVDALTSVRACGQRITSDSHHAVKAAFNEPWVWGHCPLIAAAAGGASRSN
jgi:hypothetical protein